ncbi:putative membrane protein [Halorubrum sp. AJ67]|nr:putative membrane protein [Halorubrum sp. AJ67]
MDMSTISLLPGVTAPAAAVLGGVWLVHGGTVAIGAGFVLAALVAWAYVN